MNAKTIFISIISLAVGVVITLVAINNLGIGSPRDLNPDVVMGDPDSKIEIIEYASLGCPHCANLHNKVFPKLKSDLIDSNKVKYVFRAVPTNPASFNAAVLISCADKDKRPDLVNDLFKNQRQWLGNQSPSELRAIGERHGVDKDDFYACMEDKKLAAAVNDTKRTGESKYNVRGVPSIIINGERLEAFSSAEDIIGAVKVASQGKSPNEEFRTKAKEAAQISKDDKFIGSADAPITIVEYASLSCPHCAHFHNEVLPVIKKEYVDTGKVKLVYRHYPLNAPALKAAMIAECADKKQFFPLLSSLFKDQKKWAFEKDFAGKMQEIAKANGISKSKFDSCFENKEIETRLLTGTKQAASIGVSSTPTFFVNGEKGDHLHSADEFRKALDKLISQSRP